MNPIKTDYRETEYLYRLLGRFFRQEADEEFLDQLRRIGIPEDTASEEFNEGAKELNAFLREDKHTLDDLAADYARVFLAAGIGSAQAAFPFESVYTSPEKLVMQDAYEEVMRIYSRHGLVTGKVDVYPDHIGLELEFMSWLNGKAQKAMEANDEAALERNLAEQAQFLQNHLQNWAPNFCQDVIKYSELPFYPSAAKMTSAFLRAEETLFAHQKEVPEQQEG